MGSTVVYGRGRAVVVGTGMNTEMGKIASALTSAKKELTPLQMKLNELSGILTKLVLAICVIIFGVDIVRHFGELGSNPAMMLDTFMVAMKLNELSGILTKLVLAICVIIFGVDIVRHFGELGSNPAMMLDTFMVAVSLAVAAIPEGLVAVSFATSASWAPTRP